MAELAPSPPKQHQGGTPELNRNQVVKLGGERLYMFLRGEPMCIGIAILMLGATNIFFSLSIWTDAVVSGNLSLAPIIAAVLLVLSGIICMASERKPTKKMVTACLALNIIGAVVNTSDLVYQFQKVLYTAIGHYGEKLCSGLCWDIHLDVIYSTAIVMFITIGTGVILQVTMCVFAIIGLRSIKTRMVTVTMPATT